MIEINPSDGQAFIQKVSQLTLLIAQMDLLMPWDRIVSSISNDEPRMLRAAKAEKAAEALERFRKLYTEINDYIVDHTELDNAYADRLFELNNAIIKISNNLWLIKETKDKNLPPILTTGLDESIAHAERLVGIGHVFDLDDEVEIMGVPGVREDFVGKNGVIVSIRRIKGYEHHPLNTDRYQYTIYCSDGRERDITRDEHLRLIRKGRPE